MFKYNPRILELIKGEPLVISSGLGTGKTQSVKQYVSTTTTRTLVVVNDTLHGHHHIDQPIRQCVKVLKA